MRPWVETVLKVVVMGATMYSGFIVPKDDAPMGDGAKKEGGVLTRPTGVRPRSLIIIGSSRWTGKPKRLGFSVIGLSISKATDNLPWLLLAESVHSLFGQESRSRASHQEQQVLWRRLSRCFCSLSSGSKRASVITSPSAPPPSPHETKKNPL